MLRRNHLNFISLDIFQVGIERRNQVLGLQAAAKERAPECFPAARLLCTSHPDSLLNYSPAAPQPCEQTWTYGLERNNGKPFPGLRSRKTFPLKEVIPDYESSLVSGLLKSGLLHKGKGSRVLGGGEAGRGSVFPSKDAVLQCSNHTSKQSRDMDRQSHCELALSPGSHPPGWGAMSMGP